MVTMYKKAKPYYVSENGKNQLKKEYFYKGVCLSTDTKPIENITNGSQLLEMDTNKTYIYDVQNQEWLEINSGNNSDSSSGGSGGGGSDAMLVIQFSYNSDITDDIGMSHITAYSTMEYTADDLAEAWKDGKRIKAIAIPRDENDGPQECLITSFLEDNMFGITLWGTSYGKFESSLSNPYMWRIEDYEIEVEGETYNPLVLTIVGPTGD